MAKSQTPSCRGAEPLSDCALCAQGCRETCGLAGVLPPWHDRRHGSRKGQCPLTPDCALCAQSARRKADWLLSTAIRRRASWLAGLVWLCASWIGKTAVGRQALAACSKGQRGFDFPLAFCLAKKHKPRQSIPPAGVEYVPAPTAGEQSGDRQRREKGPPILTAEKGEHERAPRAGESYPTLLRATLRAPPSKWAIKAFFP